MITGNRDRLLPLLIDKLEEVSKNTGKDVNITSGFRTGGSGRHETMLAADVSIEGLNTFEICRELIKAGFTGLGQYINFDGTPAMFSHGDIIPSRAGRWVQFETALGSRRFAPVDGERFRT